MRQKVRSSARITLSTLLGLAVCATVGLGSGPAYAQKMDHDKMEMDDDNYTMGIPTAPSYPMAAPGMLDMNHWTDYSRRHMRTGSATEAKMDKMRERDAMKSMMTEDEVEGVPTSMGYPRTSPGMIDMNHWSDYTRRHMRSGSASEAKMDAMHEKERMRRMEHSSMEMDEEDEANVLPATMSYPAAAPGTLDMNYWTDWRRRHMKAGSSHEAKMEKMKMKGEMKMEKPQ